MRRSNTSPPMRRRVALATLAGGLAVAALTLMGCSAGQHTATAEKVSAVPGINLDAGPAGLRNALVAFNGKGYPTGSDVPLVVRLFNNGSTPLTLTGVTTTSAKEVRLMGGPAPSPTVTRPAPGESASARASADASANANASASASASASPSPTVSTPPGTARIALDIPAYGYLDLVPGSGRQYLALSGLNRAIAPGDLVKVAFSFKTADGQVLTMDDVTLPMAPPLSPEPRVSVSAPAEE